jgi:hypothetical protein
VKAHRWEDLSMSQKIIVSASAALQIGLLAAALWDLARRSPEEVRGDRRMWAGLVFINWIGPLAYFSIGRRGGLSLPSCRRRRDNEAAGA